MRRVESYQVTDLVFSLDMDANDKLWRNMKNYDPFKVLLCGHSLFTLKVVECLPEIQIKDVLAEMPDNNERICLTSQGYLKESSIFNGCPQKSKSLYSKDFSKGEVVLTTHNKATLDSAIMGLYSFAKAKYGALQMHASCVIKDGKAILFHAPSGTGKSTHSQQWMKAFPDAELLNDDHPIVRVWPDGRVIAYGSPWSGKTPCYKNLSAPVAAFVRINRAKENKIHRLRLVEAYASLLPSCTGVKWNDDIRNYTHETMQKVISTVPFYQLDCLPNEDAARVCAAEVLKER